MRLVLSRYSGCAAQQKDHIAKGMNIMESLVRDKVYKKAMVRIIPFAFLLYFFNGIDRGNVGFAALKMNKDLGITSLAFGTISSAFFISYLLFQIPSNQLLKKFGASKIIPTLASLWGIATALLFFAKDPTQVIILRFLLGAVEAGFFPGVMYWFTLWFPNRERARVTSLFMIATSVSGIVASPVAGLIVQYVNWMGFAGWRWLFLLEGLPPALIALLGFAIMKDSPEQATWLTPEEKAMIRKDLDEEKVMTSGKSQANQKVGLFQILGNGMLWKMAMIYMFVQIATQTATLWMPVLMKEFASELSASQIGFILMIPGITGAFTIVINGNHSDKTGERKYHAIIPMLILAASFLLIIIPFGGLPFKILMLAIYGATVFCWYGPYWTMPPAFLSSEILAVAIAFINSCSAIGGYVGNQLSGVIDTRFGSSGVFIFLAGVTLVSVVLIMTLDFSKVKVGGAQKPEIPAAKKSADQTAG